MRQVFPLFFLALFILSCSSKDAGDEQLGNNGKTDTASINSQNDSSATKGFPKDGNFYRHYKGTLNGNIPIHMNVVRIKDKIRASYYYDRYGRPIMLMNGSVDKDGAFHITEFSPTYAKTGTIVAQFYGNEISGTWSDADSSQHFPIQLEESMDAYSMPLEVFYDDTIVPLVKDKKESPNFTFIYTVVFPDSDHKNADKAYATFESLFGKDMVKGNPWATIDDIQRKKVKEYREANLEIYQEDPSYVNSMFWSEITHMDVIYNDNDILSAKT